jgi:uroporphyrin-III C-methyltransferase
VAFIGAGPGAADLITVRGAQRLAQADVVLFDALTDPALRAWRPRPAGWTWASAAFGRHRAGCHQCAAGAARWQARLRVVRLKGGDPSVFGRLEEEMQALQRPASLRGGARRHRRTGRRRPHPTPADPPRRGRSVSLTTAMTRGPLQATRTADTEVFYMAGRNWVRWPRACWKPAGPAARRPAWSRAPAGPTPDHRPHLATWPRHHCCMPAAPPW